MSGSTQFEGRTAEEAVARARATLGDSGAVRCWKTRRGGVGGFFAREIFVASLTPPRGSEGPRTKAARSEPGNVVDGSTVDALQLELADETGGPGDHLSGLVEATSDPLSLGSLAIPAGAFDQVLAEAEAALSRDAESSGVSAPDRAVPPTQQPATETHEDVAAPEAVPHDRTERSESVTGPDESVAARKRQQPAGVRRPAGAQKATRPKPKARGGHSQCSACTTGQSRAGDASARIPDLGPGLRSLGVPRPYLPRGRRPSLDALADAMATLPVPPALPSHHGATVAVVGAGEDLARAVTLVSSELALGPGDVLRFDESTEAAPLARQIDRRRARGSTVVVSVDTGPGLPLRGGVCRLLDHAAPDYVLAAVGAGCKRVDVEHWVADLPTVDALALWDLSRTRTPAEVLGVCPIAFVEGEASSTLGWTLLLAARAMVQCR